MGKIADTIRGLAIPQQKYQKLLSLDEEFSALEAKIKILEIENRNLQADINPLKREVEQLKEQAKNASAREGHGKLDPTSEKMLSLIANDRDSIREMIFSDLRLAFAKGSYHFDLLKERHFVDTVGALPEGLICVATPLGRKYLAENGLL